MDLQHPNISTAGRWDVGDRLGCRRPSKTLVAIMIIISRRLNSWQFLHRFTMFFVCYEIAEFYKLFFMNSLRFTMFFLIRSLNRCVLQCFLLFPASQPPASERASQPAILGPRRELNQSQRSRFADFLALAPELDKIDPRSRQNNSRNQMALALIIIITIMALGLIIITNTNNSIPQ